MSGVIETNPVIALVSRHRGVAEALRQKMLEVEGASSFDFDVVETRLDGIARKDRIVRADVPVYVIPEQGLSMREEHVVVLHRADIDHYVYVLDLAGKTGMDVRGAWRTLKTQVEERDDQSGEESSLAWFITPMFRDERGDDILPEYFQSWCLALFRAARFKYCRRFVKTCLVDLQDALDDAYTSPLQCGLLSRQINQLLQASYQYRADAMRAGDHDYGLAQVEEAESYVETVAVGCPGDVGFDFDLPKRKNSYQAHRANMLHVVGKCTEEMQKHNIEDHRQWSSIVQRLESDTVEMIVVGKMKAGKSTLVNRLIGRDIQGTHPTPDTCVITHVHHDEEGSSATVHFKDSVEITIFRKRLNGKYTFSRDAAQLVLEMLRSKRHHLRETRVREILHRHTGGWAIDFRAMSKSKLWRELAQTYLGHFEVANYTKFEIEEILHPTAGSRRVEQLLRTRIIVGVTLFFEPMESRSYSVRTKKDLEAFKETLRRPSTAVRVDRVDVGLKKEVLRGTTIIDTPGTGSLHQWHDDVTLSYLANSEAMKLFLVPAFKGDLDGDDKFLLKAIMEHSERNPSLLDTDAFLCVTRMNQYLSGHDDKEAGAQLLMDGIQRSVREITKSKWNVNTFRIELMDRDPGDQLKQLRRSMEEWLRDSRTKKLLVPSATALLRLQRERFEERRAHVEALSAEGSQRKTRIEKIAKDVRAVNNDRTKLQRHVSQYEQRVEREIGKFFEGLIADVDSIEKIRQMIEYFEKKEFSGCVTKLGQDMQRIRQQTEKATGIKLPDERFHFEKSLMEKVGAYGLECCPKAGIIETVKKFELPSTRLAAAKQTFRGNIRTKVDVTVGFHAMKGCASQEVKPKLQELDSAIIDKEKEIAQLQDDAKLKQEREREEAKLRWVKSINEKLHEGVHIVLGYFECGMTGCSYRE